MGVNKCMCSVPARPSLSRTVMKRIRGTRGTNKWTSARSAHVALCRCFPPSPFQTPALSGRCAVSKEPPHLWRIKGEMFSTPPQLEADVLSPTTPSYLQSPLKPTSKSVRSFDLSGELTGEWGGGGVGVGGWRWKWMS